MSDALWSPADGSSGYVRRLRSGGFLVYHRDTCRHACGRDDNMPVSEDEVRRALETCVTDPIVEFLGKRVFLWPCRVCLSRRRVRTWP